MQLGQKVRLLMAPLTFDGQELNLDDNIMLIKLVDVGRTNPIRTCQAGVALDVLARAKDGAWEGDAPADVLAECKTAVVILTSIPEGDIMGIMEQVFRQLFPGGRMEAH